MGSTLFYFTETIGMALHSFQPAVAAVLSILFALSAAFYVGGFILFVYEVVMEYHHQKWSEPIDEELVKIIGFMKRVGQRIEHKGKLRIPQIAHPARQPTRDP